MIERNGNGVLTIDARWAAVIALAVSLVGVVFGIGYSKARMDAQIEALREHAATNDQRFVGLDSQVIILRDTLDNCEMRITRLEHKRGVEPEVIIRHFPPPEAKPVR